MEHTKLEKKVKRRRQKKEKMREGVILACLTLALALVFSSIVLAVPTGPSGINITANETKVTTGGQMVNISGGIISKMNITASVQNPHWKAFVGWIDGRFTLDDSSGSTIYDWTLSSIGGEVYATRRSAAVDWGNVACADAAQVNSEDVQMAHTGEDNISSTFTDNNNSETFVVAGTTIGASTCFATNTYISSSVQDVDFEEVILYDTTNTDIIFATILEEDLTGYDGSAYDFQMIIPENGSETWNGAIPYYLYVELS